MLKKKFHAHMQKHKDDKKEMEDAEQEAKKAEISKMAKEGAPKDRAKKAHPFTGNVHNADGSQTHVDNGFTVDGANHWSQRTAADKWADHVEQESSAAQTKAKSRAAKAGVDGLIHNEDGTEEFLEGGVVGGANNGYDLA